MRIKQQVIKTASAPPKLPATPPASTESSPESHGDQFLSSGLANAQQGSAVSGFSFRKLLAGLFSKSEECKCEGAKPPEEPEEPEKPKPPVLSPEEIGEMSRDDLQQHFVDVKKSHDNPWLERDHETQKHLADIISYASEKREMKAEDSEYLGKVAADLKREAIAEATNKSTLGRALLLGDWLGDFTKDYSPLEDPEFSLKVCRPPSPDDRLHDTNLRFGAVLLTLDCVERVTGERRHHVFPTALGEAIEFQREEYQYLERFFEGKD